MTQFDNGYYEFAAEHRGALKTISATHIERMGGIAVEHFESADAATTPEELGRILSATAGKVRDIADNTAQAVESRLQTSREQFLDIADPVDRQILWDAHNGLMNNGSGSGLTVISGITDLRKRNAVHSALDSTIFDRTKYFYSRMGPASGVVILNGASGRESRLAMHTALDPLLLRILQQRIAEKGSIGFGDNLEDGKSFDDLLASASDEQVGFAIRSALDQHVLDQARSWATSFGIEPGLFEDVRENASNRLVAAAIRGAILQWERQGRPGGTSSFESSHEEHGGGRSAHSSSNGHQHRRESHERRPRNLEAIIETIDDDGSKTTLLSQIRDPKGREDVERVVSQVRTMRREAESRGQTLTAREIYLGFRKKIVTENPDAELEEDAKTLLNLMGGEPKGDLTF